jgi:RHS repeat-associated protein
VASGQGSGYLKGGIAEIVVCLGVVEEGRRQAVEEYLARRYFPKERSDMRYTGHYYHTKSGLHLAPYRAYDAKHGVWLSEDPIQEEGGINLYGYVGNSPLRKMDPLGLFGYDADGSVNWFSVGDDVCDIAKNGLGTGVMQALDGLNPFDDPFANGGWIPEGADTNYAAQIAGYTNPAGLGLRGAQGLGLANALAKSKALGLGSKILGRGGKFGNKGKANANNLCRVGWSWKGSSQAGKNVLRMATGKPLKSGPQWLRSLWDKVRHMDILE